MTSFDQRPETARGRALYEMLISVHALIRQELERVEALGERARDGLSPEDVRQELDEIKRGGVLWRLQFTCLRYCRFVHAHHHAEDADFFSELRSTNPAINPVVDRLEGDHRRVAQDLDAVETAANALTEDEGDRARKELVDALQALGENLLEHLEYEERSLEATVRRLREAPVPF
jgi:hemerythrin-like domain-containing protein